MYVVACDTSGAVDATVAIQNAVDAAIAGGGGRVILPAGRILVNGGVAIDDGRVTIEGQGWQDYKGYFAQYAPAIEGNGTYVHQTSAGSSCFNFLAGSSGSEIRDIGFTQAHAPDGPGWSPSPYAPSIRHVGAGPNMGGGSLLVRRCMFFGCNSGIRHGEPSAPIGRATVEDCCFACFDFGIEIACSGDTCRFHNNHFYPFNVTNSHQVAYIQNHTIAVRSLKNDNPMFSNCFVYGHKYGFFFGHNASGFTTKIKLTNCEADSTVVGIYIDAGGMGEVLGEITNYNYQADWNGSTGLPSSVGIFVKSQATLFVTNCELTFAQANAVRIEGTDSDISFCNLRINKWNMSGSVWPGVEVTDKSSRAYISGRFQILGGGGAPATSHNVATSHAY
jgi:hypothetical protein